MNRHHWLPWIAFAALLATSPLAAQEDCIPFNPDQVEAKLAGSGWKVVQGGMWMMDFGAGKAEAEKAVQIIKHYRMTQQCFVGRPAPEGKSLMMYFKTPTGVPLGAFPGEDSIKFDPAKVEARNVNGAWKVVQGAMWMLDFGASEPNARKAVQIIKENGFQYQCFVGRPDAPMMYFRKDVPPPPVVAEEDCIPFNPDQVEAKLVGSGWKVVQGGMWMMDFGAEKAEAEKAVQIIKHYRMTQQCFVGRPAPEGRSLMMYFKTATGVPMGAFPGEDSIKFDPTKVEARNINGTWKVVQGAMAMLDFATSEANARRAVQVIKENGFQYQCFVGRPNAPMMYFRKDAPPVAEVLTEDCIPFNPEQVEAKLVGSGWKVVQGGMWMMDFGAEKAQAEKAVQIIKHYRMTQQCFVGRPAPEGKSLMMYFRTPTGVPMGAFPGEDSIKFDPAKVEARNVNGAWKVVQGTMWMLDFGASEANARKAARIIKDNGFQYQCFVGRPNAPMMYFRKDGPPVVALPAATEESIPFRSDKVKVKLRSGNWSIVDGDKVILSFGDKAFEALKALQIIKHYDMNAMCSIGRADGGMQYFRTKKGVPSGSYFGEDAIEFDPGRLEVKQVEGRWKVIQDTMSLLDFKGSEANARLALETIRKNGFRYQCFVGRPDASMMYFRK